MSVPNLPPFYAMQWTYADGEMTHDSILFMDDVIQTLLELVNQYNNGIQMPQKTTSKINAFGSDSTVPNGTMWFDTDVGKLKVKTASGTIETITSS